VSTKFLRAGTIEELKSKRRLVVRGSHRPILVVADGDRVYALDNRCPHMGFPLDRGSIEDGILTCHWHHARFDLASGCTFDLWADDVPTCAVELRGDEVWIQTDFGHSDAAAYWQRRLEQGMAHNLGLVIAKAIQGQLAAGVPPIEIVRQAALFGARNRDGWDTGMIILTALGNLLPILSHSFKRFGGDASPFCRATGHAKHYNIWDVRQYCRQRPLGCEAKSRDQLLPSRWLEQNGMRATRDFSASGEIPFRRLDEAGGSDSGFSAFSCYRSLGGASTNS